MTTVAAVRGMRDEDVEQVIAVWRASGVARPWNNSMTGIAFARRGPHPIISVAASGGRVAAAAMVGEKRAPRVGPLRRNRSGAPA